MAVEAAVQVLVGHAHGCGGFLLRPAPLFQFAFYFVPCHIAEIRAKVRAVNAKLDFFRRTEEIAAKKSLNLNALPDLLGMSRASFFAYRAGKRPITRKAWGKLAAAERSAGIAPPLEQQVLEAPTVSEKIEAWEEGSIAEKFRVHAKLNFPSALRSYLFNVQCLSDLTLKLLNDPDAETLRDARALAEILSGQTPVAAERLADLSEAIKTLLHK